LPGRVLRRGNARVTFTGSFNLFNGLGRFPSVSERYEAYGVLAATDCGPTLRAATRAASSNALQLLRRGVWILAAPGAYRTVPVNVWKNGVVVHSPPPWEEVKGHMTEFFKDLSSMWEKSSPVDIGAFCLWKLNWIHPFKNGNGRSARAFTYACLCLKYGMILPGAPTVIDLIMSSRALYENALKVGDKSFLEGGSANLEDMKTYLHDLLVQQLSTIPAATT
jgi:hypothetical protein